MTPLNCSNLCPILLLHEIEKMHIAFCVLTAAFSMCADWAIYKFTCRCFHLTLFDHVTVIISVRSYLNCFTSVPCQRERIIVVSTPSGCLLDWGAHKYGIHVRWAQLCMQCMYVCIYVTCMWLFNNIQYLINFGILEKLECRVTIYFSIFVLDVGQFFV